MDRLFGTFRQFLELLPANGLAVIDATNEYNRRLMAEGERRFLTYGLDPKMEFSATDIRYDKFSSRFMLVRKGLELGEVSLSVPGWQNILNSLAVAALAFELDIPFSSLTSGLHSFGGARRRFSLVGEYAGVMVIDDYAHHPTEVKATLAAARSGWPDRRLICAFQPHRYSRTMILKDDFATAFDVADKVIITDIYAASEAPIQGISGKTIADLLPPAKTTYIEKKELIAATLAPELRAGDIVLTLGAGDIYTVGKELLSRLRMRENENSSQ
jgi:UDP-N-acetylmuramate--alanine ligase